MKLEEKEALEKYIKDWYWDDNSHKFAYELGAYMFKFIDNLENSNLSRRTIDKHTENCWCIGLLICQYGYYDKFNVELFSYPPYEEDNFKRKFSDSRYQVQSYNSTCRKIEKFAITIGDLSQT